MMRSRPAFSFIVVAALVLGACSSGDSSSGDLTVPIPTAGTVSSTTGEPDSTLSTESSQGSTTSTGPPTSSAPTTSSTTGPPTTLIRPADLVTAEALYRVVDAAYEKRSIALSSNLHPAGFDELMPKTIANATVDRLLHHAHVVITTGDSIRLTQATRGKGVRPLNN